MYGGRKFSNTERTRSSVVAARDPGLATHAFGRKSLTGIPEFEGLVVARQESQTECGV
jgi:hypothetical protein